jgi:hypothetical protein
MAGSLKGGVTLTVKNKPRRPEFDDPMEDPIAKFGPGEYYAHEAEFFGKRAPALNRAELRYDQVIGDVIARAKERKAAGQPSETAASEPSRNWMVRIVEERQKLENALKVERVMKEQKVCFESVFLPCTLQSTPFHVIMSFLTPPLPGGCRRVGLQLSGARGHSATAATGHQGIHF